MIKKIVVGTAVAVILGGVLLGRDGISYFRTAWGSLKQTAQNSVPLDFQIQRARQMLKDLAPEVQANTQRIAREEIEIQRLEAQATDAEARLAKDKDQIGVLRTAIATGKETAHFAGKKYTIEQVKLDLTNRFERYKTSEATLANLRQMAAARQRGLDAARQKLETMIAAKRQIQLEIENLEARNQLVAAAKSSSNYQFDETQLGRLKELLSDLKTRLDVDEKLLAVDSGYSGEIPLDTPATDDISDRVSEYFKDQPKKADVAARK